MMAQKKTKAISDVLKETMKKLSSPSRPSEEDISALWGAAAGSDAARHSKPVAIKRSELIVEVDSSGWLYELTLRKKAALKNLEGKLGKKNLKNIRLRIGDMGSGIL
jgi:predicted nucleic acid-binding Zn ribbon protein